MSFTRPDWWRPEGAFPNIENVLRDFLAGKLGPDVTATYWLPKPDVIAAQIASGKGYLRIYRTGGRINREQKRDEPRVQFAAFMPSRDDSWELIEIVRQFGEALAATAVLPDTTTKLKCTGEVVGPQLIPELLQDDKLVPITLEFHTWRQRDLMTTFRQALGL